MSIRAASNHHQLAIWLLVLVLTAISTAGCQDTRFFAASGWSGAYVTQDTLYIGTREAKLVALEKETGILKWTFPGEEDEQLGGIYSSPTISENSLYIGSYGESEGTLYSLTTDTGEVQWDFRTSGHIVGSPVVYDGIVLIGSSDGNMYAVDAEKGIEIWHFSTQSMVWSTPLVHQGAVYFGSLDHNVYAVELETGEQIWNFETSGGVASTPIQVNGRIYIGSFDNNFYAINATTGQSMWSKPFAARNWFWSEAVSDGNVIYVGSLDGYLYAIDADNGTNKWPQPFDTGAPIVSTPVFIPEGIVVANDDGDVYLIRVRDAKEVRSFSAKDHIRAPLAAQDSTIYISSMNSLVRAADLAGGFWKELWCYDTKESTLSCT